MSDDSVTVRDIIQLRSAQLLTEAEARQTDWQAEAMAELNRIQGNQSNKKRDTIIAIVDARLAGRPEESVWSLPQTCARSTYHDKWKQDPTFADVLESVSTLARTWKDGEAMRALSEAARRLALASPIAVTTLIAKLQSHDENIQVRSSLGILDRAGMETATKSASEVSGPDGGAINVDVTQLSDEQLYGILSGKLSESDITSAGGNRTPPPSE